MHHSLNRCVAITFLVLLFNVVVTQDSPNEVRAADVILNEYNAVGGNNMLDGGNGRDSVFGTIAGNGGNWFELLVVGDRVDLRGWELRWTEDEPVDAGGTAAGTLFLSNNDLWSDIRAGSLLTFVETVDAGEVGDFSTATDVSYDPAAGDWAITVSTQEEATKGDAALVTTTTNDGDPGDFSVGKDDWTLTIVDATGTTVFGPAGEGAMWAGGGVNGEEAGSLEGPISVDGVAPSVAIWQSIGPDHEAYDDTGSTSFGMPNVDFDDATMTFIPIQDFSALRGEIVNPPTGDGDFDGDGQLTASDIDALTVAVRNGDTSVQFDLDGDGQVLQSDRAVWIEQLRNSYFGDANLDGEFSSADLVTVLTAGEYEDATAGNSTWATGDWDGDGDFTTSDFVVALSGGGYEVGPRAATAAVPEPTSIGIVLLAAVVLGCRQRQLCR